MHGNFETLDMPVPAIVSEIIKQAANGASAHPLRFNGVAGTREDYEKLLRQMEKKLAHIVKQYPKEKGERVKSYIGRMFDSSPQGKDRAALLHRAVTAVANMERIDTGKDDLVCLRANADMAEYRDRSKRLLAIVEDAAEGEALLAQLFDALKVHRAAQAARGELSVLFSKASAAAHELNKAAPLRLKVSKAPDGAVDMAGLLGHARKS